MKKLLYPIMAALFVVVLWGANFMAQEAPECCKEQKACCQNGKECCPLKK
jgi:hypothetical protein